MNLYLPGCPVCLKYCRTNFMAASTASEPPLNGFTYFRLPGVTEPIFPMKSSVTSAMPCSGAANVIFSICLRIASISRGCPCPSVATKIPPMASK